MAAKSATSIAVVACDEALPPGVDATALLGGKAAGLAVMARDLGLPVPPAFVVTTAVCRRYLAEGALPTGVREQIEAGLAGLGERTGRRLGSLEAPLLVSVRSGAPVSMPGMMDTILNVGITPAIRDRLAEESGSAEFAADTWLRFARMYTEIVLGVPGDEVAAAALHQGDAASTLAAAERVQELAARFGGIPEEPVEQVVRCVEAVFRSWDSPRAQVFRQREGIDGTMGTAATVQAMVFGNLDDHSGTGVVFTRDPATGANEPFGDYLARAQGEDVVAGTHAVSGLARLREQMPAVYDELLKTLRVLERHYRDMCDVEFTVSSGKLYILQTRIGRRSPLAAVRIAVDMAEDPEFPLSRAEAAARIDDGVLQQLAAQRSVKPEAVAVASGLAASPGVGSGLLCCDADRAAALAESDTPVVLARNETAPEDVHGMIGAAAIVTTLGGVASHAAVVARSWAIPAICSLAGARVEEGGLRLSDRFIPEGTTVTVDGSRGLLYEGDCCAPGVEEIPELRIIREWAREPLFRGGEEEATAEASLLDVVRTIQLKGLCSPERAAAALGAATGQVEALIAANEGLFKPTPRGLALTPEGRTWLSARLQEERTSIDSAAMDACYERFTPLNEQFKRLVSDWQRSSAHGAGEDRFAALVRDMRDLHEAFLPVVDTAGAVAPRLARYAARFANALAALATGDVSMLASPLKDSYHTVWFEFHEELITLSGRDRASEET